MKLSDQRTDLVPQKMRKGLDDLLKHFELGARDPEQQHDAEIDCKKTAQIYIKLKEVKAGNNGKKKKHVSEEEDLGFK